MKHNKILLPNDPAHAKTPWLWIGTWSMGGQGFGRHDEGESLDVLYSAAEQGLCHFDTAGFYAQGRSEDLVQKIIRGQRQRFFISSKGGLVWSGRQVKHYASPEALRNQLFRSLDRLKTDYLDLYQLHWPDPEVPLEESINALRQFRKEGIIRFWGVGNFTGRQVEAFLSEESDVPHQVHFNPVHRDEVALLAGKERCINYSISPLEQGLLGTGKSSSGATGIGKADIRRRNPYFSDPRVKKWNSVLNELVKEHSLHKVSLILKWICTRPHVHGVIPGPRKMGQLQEILEFRREVEERQFQTDSMDSSILSERKVISVVPGDVWQHLCAGPESCAG